MRVLGIVTARGGSKGVPRKNLCLLCGKPLLQYTAEAALAAQRLSRTIVSTDDEEIVEAARGFGLEVPFLRPAELARDDTPTLPVLQHAVRTLEAAGDYYDAVCLLQPTHPLRSPKHIDACIELLESSGADAVMTILPVPEKYNPHWVYLSDENGNLRLSTGEATPIPRRQQLPQAYHRDGSVYVTLRDVLIEQDSLYGRRVIGLPLDPQRSVNIDSWADLRQAESLVHSMVESRVVN